MEHLVETFLHFFSDTFVVATAAAAAAADDVTSATPYQSFGDGLHDFCLVQTHFEIRETHRLPTDLFPFFPLFDGYVLLCYFQRDFN